MVERIDYNGKDYIVITEEGGGNNAHRPKVMLTVNEALEVANKIIKEAYDPR